MEEARVTKLFSDFVVAHEKGLGPNLEDYCKQNPQCAEGLRELHSVWQHARAMLGDTDDLRDPTIRGSDSIGLKLSPPDSRELDGVPTSLLARLTHRGPPKQRFDVKERIGQGGMGEVYRVYDHELRRHVAAKVARSSNPIDLPRFLEEAQITGQLDHPAFIPVHDIGVDENGKVFFTMKLVKGVAEEGRSDVRGETLLDLIERIHTQQHGEWTLTRGISDVIVRVAEAMAFAHAKGVIHRDLKPSNILVGRYGEVYVTDFGIARVRGLERANVPRSEQAVEDDSPDEGVPLTRVRTERRDSIDRNASTPPPSDKPVSFGLTEEGATIGTAEYMPPEQAKVRLAEIGPASDIYSLGATLYHLIAGVPPWHTKQKRPSRSDILRRIADGDEPSSLHTLTPHVPAELAAIVERAMAREPRDRYASMQEFAVDLRAYLERRVVSAYETGAFAELKKWIQRNRALSAAAGVLVLVLAGATAIIERRGSELAKRTKQYDQLAAVVKLRNARKSEELLYPAWPEKIEAMETWLRIDAQALLDLKPDVAATLFELESFATRTGSGDSASWTFADTAQGFLHTTLSELANDITRFESATIPEVKQRLAWAQRIGDLTLHHPRARVSWDEAREAIRRADDRVASKLYARSPGGPIDLKPQMGLVPIGMNPVTKLWEFYELRSACDVAAGQDPATVEIPTHRPDGSIEVKDETGIIFVLLPGSTYLQGAQKSDPSAPNYFPKAQDDELPQEVTLTPFFMARHEVTIAQWRRLAGEEPSYFTPTFTPDVDREPIGSTHPVNQVDWATSERVLSRLGLALPTEARWEYGARGGSSDPWWCGTEARSLFMNANILDLRGEERYEGWGRQKGDFDDGFIHISPVGYFRANEFGLFDIHGNVWEACIDPYKKPYGSARAGDGLRMVDESSSTHRISRGGSCTSPASVARSAFRNKNTPTSRDPYVGFRACRDLDPNP